MESIHELFRIGTGPSSSHTMAPRKAAEGFLRRHPDAACYRVTLFGSLAATGRGHLTDRAIAETFHSHSVSLIWKPETQLPLHPNGMRFEAFSAADELLDSWEVYSVGGGALLDKQGKDAVSSIYELNTLEKILEHSRSTDESLWEYVLAREDADIIDYLSDVWDVMFASIERGLSNVGVLPSGLGLGRKALSFYRKASLYGSHVKYHARVWAYALALSEENASGGVIVAAPTCGASGVLPAVLRYLNETLDCGRDDILRALATAGLVGNLVKHNASISGAEVGCQDKHFR